MAQKNNKQFIRSLVLLDRSVSLVVRLGDLVGENNGRVGVLRDRLRRSKSDLDAHRKRQPHNKRLVRRKADRVLAETIDYLTALIEESVEHAKMST